MIWLPPTPYDHPFAYPSHLIVETLDYWEVDKACRAKGAAASEGRYEGCTWTWSTADGEEGCHMILPRLGTGGIGVDDLVRLIRHETGHCNGWPADHEGAIS